MDSGLPEPQRIHSPEEQDKMDESVIHHVELCVFDMETTLQKLKKHGFRPFACRDGALCKQVAVKLNNIVFLVTQKRRVVANDLVTSRDHDPLTVLCSRCEDGSSHVDTVFNVALNVRDVASATKRVGDYDPDLVARCPATASDPFGDVSFSVVKSTCGNVVHTLLNRDDYRGPFLPGFTTFLDSNEDEDRSEDLNTDVTHIDHVTMACHSGSSNRVMEFYRTCFGMEKFHIARDDEEDGLIIKQGVGIRLQAMEYWRCSERGLITPRTKNGRRRLMIVLVESLPGQQNCNIHTFLNEHKGPGVEHIAFSTREIIRSVRKMTQVGVRFRLPPKCYYDLRKMPEITEIQELNVNEISKLGILVDRERDDVEEEEKPKYLMQIFSLHVFEHKTFFVEYIQRRNGSRSLGAGNIVALVRSIREDERRKAAERKFGNYHSCDSTTTSTEMLRQH